MLNDPRATHQTWRILLVEDDDVDAELFERAVGRWHLPIDIVRARDGEAALQVLRTAPAPEQGGPDLIVLDLNLPRIGGLEFLATMRAEPELTAKPVFVLTTSAAPHDVATAFRHHVAAYLVKDVAGTKLDGCMGLLQTYLAVGCLPSRSFDRNTAGTPVGRGPAPEVR